MDALVRQAAAAAAAGAAGEPGKDGEDVPGSAFARLGRRATITANTAGRNFKMVSMFLTSAYSLFRYLNVHKLYL